MVDNGFRSGAEDRFMLMNLHQFQDQGLSTNENGVFMRDMRGLEEMFCKLNSMTQEFVPTSISTKKITMNINGGCFTNNISAGNVVYLNAFANDCGNTGRRRKNGYDQAKKRTTSTTSTAQRIDAIRRTVYVSELDHRITEEQLAALFLSCGQIVDCRVCGDPKSILRFAFIEFTDKGAACTALSLSGTMLGYYPVKVTPSKTAIAPVNPTFLPQTLDEREMCARTVYVTNIDKKVSQANLKVFFETVCGKVDRLKLLGDHHHSSCIAFVEFAVAQSAIAALNCSGAILGSLAIRVGPSKTPVRAKAPRIPVPTC